MLRYDDASVGARDRETADGPAGSGAVRGRRVRELHVEGADFKGTSVRVVPWEGAWPWEGAAQDSVRRGTDARGAARTTSRRGAWLARNRFTVPLFERENLQKIE
jgi:hypothetical protein